MNKHSRNKQLAERHKEKIYQKKLWYKGIKFCSLFEVDVVKYLDQLNIIWIKNEKQFPAIMDDGKILHYLPDLYLPEHDVFLEIKGIWFSEIKKIKTFKAVEQNGLHWTYILLNEWKQSKKILKNKLKKYVI